MWGRVTDLCCWNIGDGKRIDFWRDKWLQPGCSLADCVVEGRGVTEEKVLVCDMIREDGDWNMEIIEDLLPSEIVNMIIGRHPPMEGCVDKIEWALESTEKFSVSSCYRSFMGEKLGSKESCWEIIWRWRGMERVKYFLCLLIMIG